MTTGPIPEKNLRTAVICLMALVFSVSAGSAAEATGEEELQIEMLIGTYYTAVAAEDVDEVVDLYHWENSFERDKVTHLVEQAFAVADSDFERILVRSIDLYPERGIGLARVSVDFTARSSDGTDSFSGHQEAAIVVVNRGRGWRIGKVARAAAFDLTAAVSRLGELSQELDETVPQTPAGSPESPPKQSKLPKLATAAVPAGAGPSTTASNSPSVAAPGTASGGLTFFALRRKATGQCEVVAGAEGISPGDTVLGAFPDFSAARQVTVEKCGGATAAVSADSSSVGGAGALTTERLYDPDDTVTRGSWGTVTRIADDDGFANATDGGQPLEDGFFVHPGSSGPTEIIYAHDASPATLQGRATIIDCLSHCGRGGTVTFAIHGDGKELWNSGLVRHPGPGQAFAVHLEGVSELRLVSTDGGNGNGEDWAAWLDLRIGDDAPERLDSKGVTVSPVSPAGPSILAIPRYRADESTAGAWVIDLEDGSTVFVDRVGIDGNTYRRRAMNLNAFTVLGRPNDRPARPGEILAGEIRSRSGAVVGLFLVETSTGAAAYLADLENDPHRATYRPVNGRPAGAIASDDGSFALVMRRDGAGGTDGAYLYHATTGQCVYFANVDEMRPDPVVTFTSPLPKMSGRSVALPLQSAGEATPQGLLVDEDTGEIYKVGGLEREPVKLTVALQRLGLFEFFPASPEHQVSPRFVLIPGYSDNGAADSVFIIDSGSGRMAVLKNVRAGSGMHLVGSTKSLEGHLPGLGDARKALAAVPKVGGSGTTDGAWVFDSSMNGVLVLENVRGPHNLKIRKVARGSN